MAIKKLYAAKTVAVQTEIKVGSNKVKAMAMELLGKRNSPKAL